jgi:hypothetical protein
MSALFWSTLWPVIEQIWSAAIVSVTLISWNDRKQPHLQQSDLICSTEVLTNSTRWLDLRPLLVDNSLSISDVIFKVRLPELIRYFGVFSMQSRNCEISQICIWESAQKYWVLRDSPLAKFSSVVVVKEHHFLTRHPVNAIVHCLIPGGSSPRSKETDRDLTVAREAWRATWLCWHSSSGCRSPIHSLGYEISVKLDWDHQIVNKIRKSRLCERLKGMAFTRGQLALKEVVLRIAWRLFLYRYGKGCEFCMV